MMGQDSPTAIERWMLYPDVNAWELCYLGPELGGYINEVNVAIFQSDHYTELSLHMHRLQRLTLTPTWPHSLCSSSLHAHFGWVL